MPLQDSVDECPLVMLEGFAVNDPIAGARAVTVTLALAVAFPPGPFTVNV